MNTNSVYIRGSMAVFDNMIPGIFSLHYKYCKKDNKKVILSLPARVNTICKTRQKSSKSSQALSACALFVCIQLISSVMFLFPWTITVTFCFKCARTSFTCCPSCVISCPTLMCCTCVQLSSRSHAIQVSRVPFVLCQILFFFHSRHFDRN